MYNRKPQSESPGAIRESLLLSTYFADTKKTPKSCAQPIITSAITWEVGVSKVITDEEATAACELFRESQAIILFLW